MTSTHQNKPAKFALVPKVVNGGIAGVVGITCVFPIDLVKTRLQNQQILPGGRKMYKSIFDCAVKTFRSEGFIPGMYRGLGVNALLITPEKAIKLSANDFFRHYLRRADGSLPLSSEVVSGAGAAICQMIMTTPLELLKIQLQDAGRSAAKDVSEGFRPNASIGAATASAPARLTATGIAMRLIREGGLFSVYKGAGPTVLRDVAFSALYFPLFAHLNAHGPRRKGSTESAFWVSFVAGCIAGGAGSFVATPFDVVKTRLQTLHKAHGEESYSGIVDCFYKVLRHEGPQAFFKGGACRILVIAPLFGIAQMVYFIGIGEYLLGYPRS